MDVEGVAAIVGAAEASSPNLPLADTIYAAVVGGWTASIAAPAASTPSPRCQAAAGCALECAGRCGGGERPWLGSIRSIQHKLSHAQFEALVLQSTFSLSYKCNKG